MRLPCRRPDLVMGGLQLTKQIADMHRRGVSCEGLHNVQGIVLGRMLLRGRNSDRGLTGARRNLFYERRGLFYFYSGRVGVSNKDMEEQEISWPWRDHQWGAEDGFSSEARVVAEDAYRSLDIGTRCVWRLPASQFSRRLSWPLPQGRRPIFLSRIIKSSFGRSRW